MLDRLSTVANQGWMMRWMAWTVRADVYRQQRNPQYLAAAKRAEQETVGISVWANASANAILLGALLEAKRFEEALVAAWACIKAPTNVGPVRMVVIPGGVRACVELGRFDEALSMIQTDFGLGLEALRFINLRAQLTGLATMLDALGRRSMLEPIARVALHLTTDPVCAGLRAHQLGRDSRRRVEGGRDSGTGLRRADARPGQRAGRGDASRGEGDPLSMNTPQPQGT